MSENTDYETLAADYIELDKKYREVTAENMLLKVAARDMLSGWKEIRRSGGENEIYGIGWGRSQSAVESALNTPATTQALNEIEARAIENALDAQVGKQAVTDALTGKAYLCAADLRQFAANLRAGRKG
ncbi:hypothetical protein ACPSVR_004554 [Yersinia enterocolitica]|nr:hypothetical protein [Yersinia enterocolitica]EKN6399386.1 hypothetical protein [Yersinia enterocolitica]EKN6412187.1 hypothetical protein [Yersinia enterocolitica]EMB6559224.1 hypothetical protein [Yersinia enterocolitica]